MWGKPESTSALRTSFSVYAFSTGVHDLALSRDLPQALTVCQELFEMLPATNKALLLRLLRYLPFSTFDYECILKRLTTLNGTFML